MIHDTNLDTAPIPEKAGCHKNRITEAAGKMCGLRVGAVGSAETILHVADLPQTATGQRG